VRIGIPRVLNLYSTGPFFRTYLEAIGIQKQNVVFSDETTEEMWVEGRQVRLDRPLLPLEGRAGAHPPPALQGAHGEEAAQVHLLPHPHAREQLRVDTMDNASCPIVAGAPDVMKAAFTKEVDFFATRGIEFLDPALSFEEPNADGAAHVRDLRPAPRHHRGRERPRLHREGWKALNQFDQDVQEKGRAILETVEARTASRSS
jgi:predicted nucleotide-binding protein (sugar kinase/HSP70/actin superfamily)